MRQILKELLTDYRIKDIYPLSTPGFNLIQPECNLINPKSY